MNRLITRACSHYGQPELVIEYEPDGVIQDDVAHLAATLEQMVRDGGSSSFPVELDLIDDAG